MRFFFIVFFILSWSTLQAEQKKFVIIIPSYNNKKYYEKNIDSILALNYEKFRVIYIDDNSPDGTGELVKEYIKKNKIAHKFSVIINKIRCYALANLYHAVHSCDDDEICVFLDGDDWFASSEVLQILNTVYNNTKKEIWLTYGNYQGSHDQWEHCREMPDEIILHNSYREYPWITSHLRTCYAALFKNIKLKDLLYRNAFYAVTWDLAFMFPMLEMSGGRFQFIQTVLYIYNTQNPLSDVFQKHEEQLRLEEYIRKEPRYSTIHGTLKNAKKIDKKNGALIIFSYEPSSLHDFLHQQKSYLGDFQQNIVVVWKSKNDIQKKEYEEIFASHQLAAYEDCSLLSTLHLLKKNEKKVDYLIVCSDQWYDETVVSLKRAIAVANQTNALLISLCHQEILRDQPTTGAFWSSDCIAYQCGYIPNNFFNSSWAYFLNVTELSHDYLTAASWQWEFWRKKNSSISYAKQVILIPTKMKL